MPRFKITIHYDGSGYNGWQVQKNAKTLQGTLEETLAVLNRGPIVRVHGAGRTDAGVHALGQVAHFNLETALSPGKLKDALNGKLPRDIRVLGCTQVSDQFHARFSAKKRTYLYRCRTDGFILDRAFTWRTGPLDLALLNRAARKILGIHDFSSFSHRCKSLEHRRCEIHESVWKADGPIVNYLVTGNRFLHHMVCYLVGTMVEISRGRFQMTDFVDLIEHPKEKVHIYKAPPHGLVLKKVEYE